MTLKKKVMISLIGVLKAISITANVSGTCDTTHSLPNFSDQNCAKHDEIPLQVGVAKKMRLTFL